MPYRLEASLALLVVSVNRAESSNRLVCRAKRRRGRCCALVAVVGSVIGGTLEAADRNVAFVEALRSAGWDDTAIDYLNWVEKSPLMTPQFAAELPYQRALSLAAQARQIKNRSERERLQTSAAEAFQQFAAGQPDSPAALDALREAANLYASGGLSTLAAAQQLPDEAASQRDEARAKARGQLQQAAEAAQQLAAVCGKALAALPKAAQAQADPEAKSRREFLRGREVEARFLRARIAFESAATFEAKSGEYAQTLEKAAGEFGELVEEYRGSVVGDTSRFYQGRCAQELGAFEKALGCYKDALGSPSANEEFRRLKARVYRRQAECLIALDKVDEAIESCDQWLAGSQPAEREQPEWLEVAYRLATAYLEKSKTPDAGGDDAKQLQSKARTLLRDVSQRTNEFQQEARLALAALGQPARNGAELRTFADAYAAGKSALEVWNSSMLAARLAKENNPDAVAELQQQAAARQAEALQLFERALELADRQTPLDDVNAVRYFLAILYWEDKRIYEAAVMGEFLAKRYPENEYAASAAKVALAAYEQAAVEARQQGGPETAAMSGASFESQRLAQLAELIASRWPQSPDASAAVNVLIQTALREDRLADAEALLARLPAESRSAAELSLGAGLWTRYLRATAGRRGAPSEEALQQRDKAGGLLKSGFARLRQQGDPSAAAAAGALYYVQYLLATGDAAAAIEVLEDGAAGPLALVSAQSPAAARPEYVLEAYKAALRAYLSAQPPQADKAEQVMVSLEEFAGGEGGRAASKKLTDIYLSLAVQLQRQLEELAAAGQAEHAAQIAAAFGHVLRRVGERPDADTWPIRSWLAQTNLQIAQSLAGDEAKAHAVRAREIYEAMLAAAAKDKNYAPDANALLAVRMRLGECLAAEGEYQRAIDQYAAILGQRPNTLDLQLAAARALMQWGAAKHDPDAIERSIQGDRPQADGKNLIWGWLRLASMAQQARRQATSGTVDAAARQRAERFRDLFFEARYNIARARRLAADAVPVDKRQEQLQAAQANVEQMKQLYPDLGGDKWETAFNELLEDIHKELAKK
ncbi:MAG: hypothetical protein IT424_09940 [Pirellulales bacterium]|nr:hypothetical protein [Pirellulales bacterium]